MKCSQLFLSVFLWMVCINPLFSRLTSSQALKELIEGNKRFANDKLLHPDRTEGRRQETQFKQEPFAIILGCSDSRVSPEIIFDQGIGDLFIVRVAGNVVSPVVLDSIEYSALYLNSSLVLVLGHESCGAVKAVLEKKTQDIEAIALLIQPSLEEIEKQPGDKVENAVKANVQQMVKELKLSPPLARLVQEGKIKIVGGYYNFHSGLVEIFD